jgi:hypothetical protein
MAKLMVSIGEENFRLLSLEARERGITLQELLRAVIVPDWVRFSNISRIHRENTPIHSLRNRKENEIMPVYGRPRN